MKLICIAAMAVLFYSCNRKMNVTRSTVSSSTFYTDAHGNKVLLGVHPKEALEQAPFDAWFTKNYNDYAVDSATANQLKPLLKNKTLDIFLGTWCGDSKRETPCMLKIFSYLGIPSNQIRLIMVDNRDSTYKQSPGHEEKGKSIHRVPTLLVYENGHEINRLVESPVLSIEKDLLAIVSGSGYQPNYKAAAYLLQLSNERDMGELVKDSAGLSQQLKERVRNSAELNSLGYVWMAAGELNKAMLAFELNAQLYPNIPNVYDSLGEINLRLNNKEAARRYYSKVLTLQPGNANAIKMLAQLN